MIIYCATNKVNNKKYIGQTIQRFSERKRLHLFESRKEFPQYPLHRSIKKYGWDNFDWSIICECDDKQMLDNMETHYIYQYYTFINWKNSKGYNVTLGSDGCYGLIHTEESKKKMSEMKSGKNHPNYGKHCSDETKERISKSNEGQKRSKETRKNISLSKQGENHYNYGKHLSEETRQKISQSQIGKIIPQEIKDKIRVTNTGKKHTEETKQKMKESHKLNPMKMSNEHKEKLIKLKSKNYEIIFLNSEPIIINNLTQWCKDNNFPKSSIKYVINKDKWYKGMKISNKVYE